MQFVLHRAKKKKGGPRGDEGKKGDPLPKVRRIKPNLAYIEERRRTVSLAISPFEKNIYLAAPNRIDHTATITDSRSPLVMTSERFPRALALLAGCATTRTPDTQKKPNEPQATAEGATHPTTHNKHIGESTPAET